LQKAERGHTSSGSQHFNTLITLSGSEHLVVFPILEDKARYCKKEARWCFCSAIAYRFCTPAIVKIPMLMQKITIDKVANHKNFAS